MQAFQSENSEKDKEELEYHDNESHISVIKNRTKNTINISKDDEKSEEIKTSYHEISETIQFNESSKLKIIKNEKQCKSDFTASESSGSKKFSAKSTSSRQFFSNKYDDDDFIGINEILC